MKRILCKLFISFVIFYFSYVLYVEFCPLCYNEPNNTRWYFIKESLDKRQSYISGVKILFLGDSRLNAAIDFVQIDSCWSFASGGTTPIENYYILKKYLSVYPKPDVVILSISPRFLTEKYAFWHYAVRNDFFNFQDIFQIDSIRKQYINDTTFDSFFLVKYFFYKLDFPIYYQRDIYQSKIFFRYKKNRDFISHMISNRGSRIIPNLKDSCSCINYEASMDSFKASEIMTEYFTDIMDLCRSENIKFYFVPMPMNYSSFRLLKSEFKKAYSTYIKQLNRQYPHFQMCDTLYYLPDSLFSDASHLNYKGKKFFTPIVKRLISGLY